MNLTDLEIPNSVKEFYVRSGITVLYPPQVTAVDLGLLKGRNMVAAVPTASGKTMIAELAMLKSILNGGKCLYIVPLRALASEKYERFRMFGEIGISAGISSGDFDSKDEWLAKTDIIVATSEKTDSLMRNGASWMERLSVIVIDEIHLLDSPDRGPTLEVILARLIKLNPKAQIIGLSATIGNAKEIAEWLGAALILSEWRPVDLREGVFFVNTIYFPDSIRPVRPQFRDDLLDLAADTLDEGGQCLIFESSRRNAEASARRFAQKLGGRLGNDKLDQLKAIAEEILETGETQLAKRLSDCISGGAAFHHAGLLPVQRKIVEDSFRNNVISVLSSTPTLAAGLNLPARRVIIRGYKRYESNYGMVPIPVLEYKQMAGRAGRPGLDPYGESVLIARSDAELSQLLEHYVMNSPENIWSKLASENALRTHVLAAVSSKLAGSREELMEFFGSTFFAHQRETWEMAAVVEHVIGFLVENEMLADRDGLYATGLGELVSRLYVDPLSASTIVDGLRLLADVNVTELTLMHLICSTPDMHPIYLRSGDYGWLGDIVSQCCDQFVHPLSPASNYEDFLSEVKTALILVDWISEKKEDDITERFNIQPGDIRAQAETAEWLMHSTARISAYLGLEYTGFAQALAERIRYGITPELLPLITIKGIGRVRARKLYAEGIMDIEALRRAGHRKLAQILGPGIAANIMKELGIDPKAGIPDSNEVLIDR